jgi:hypothetical protein
MRSRSQLIRIAYWVLTGYVAFTGIAIFLETTSLRNRFTDHAAPFCMISLFVILPIAGLTLFFLNRRCRKEHTKLQRTLMHAARAVFVVGWLFSCFPVILIIGLTQPWPLTLRHGPDTGYAREGFAKHAGFTPPSSVSQIYYRIDGGWLDVGYRLRFQVTAPDVVHRIVSRHEMTKQDEMKMRHSSSRFPKWWSEKSGRKGLECYSREDTGSYYWYLWYDPETGTVWYEEFSV